MKTTPVEATDERNSAAPIAGCVEGYLALILTVLPFLGPRVAHPGNPIGPAIYVGIAYGLALGGVRFGKGGGRLAAQVAFSLLSLWLLAVLAASIVCWEQVLWYWQH